jgi:hypothetical protein
LKGAKLKKYAQKFQIKVLARGYKVKMKVGGKSSGSDWFSVRSKLSSSHRACSIVEAEISAVNSCFRDSATWKTKGWSPLFCRLTAGSLRSTSAF